MGIECQILLRKAKEGVFRPGEAVIGTLNYFINKPTKFGSIDISFVGKGKCQWSQKVLKSTVTYSNEEEYINIYKNVFSPGGDENVLLSGNFEYPFEFLVPDDIPTSLKNPTCTIEYKVIATFVKESFFETRKIFDAEVPVYGYVNPCSPEPLVFGLEKDLFSLVNTVSSFNVKAEIDKTFVTPGENITLTLTVENNSDIPITIKTKLIKYFTYIADSEENKKVETETVETTKRHSPVIEENSVKKLTLIVPTLPSLYSIQHTKILTGEYKVRVTAKVPFPHINDMVEVPVVIGEKKIILELQPWVLKMIRLGILHK